MTSSDGTNGHSNGHTDNVKITKSVILTDVPVVNLSPATEASPVVDEPVDILAPIPKVPFDAGKAALENALALRKAGKRVTYVLHDLTTGSVVRTLRLSEARWQQIYEIFIDQRVSANHTGNHIESPLFDELAREGVAIHCKNLRMRDGVPTAYDEKGAPTPIRYAFKPIADYLLPGISAPTQNAKTDFADKKVTIAALTCLHIRQLLYVRARPEKFDMPPRDSQEFTDFVRTTMSAQSRLTFNGQVFTDVVCAALDAREQKATKAREDAKAAAEKKAT